jgi:GTP-sensing pleiotropic transcriptional regulator CodY
MQKQECTQSLVISIGNPRYSKQLVELEQKSAQSNLEYNANIDKFSTDAMHSFESSMTRFVGKLEYTSLRLSTLIKNTLVSGESLILKGSCTNVRSC